LGVAILGAGIALGIFVQRQFRWGQEAPVGAADPQVPSSAAPDVEEWKYPGAEKRGELTGVRKEVAGKRTRLVGYVVVWTTPDEYNKVISFYADKLKMGAVDLDKNPHFSFIGGKVGFGSETGTEATGFLPDTKGPLRGGTPVAGEKLTRPVQIHCLFQRTDSYDVTVIVNRADGEKYTHILLAYDVK